MSAKKEKEPGRDAAVSLAQCRSLAGPQKLRVRTKHIALTAFISLSTATHCFLIYVLISEVQ